MPWIRVSFFSPPPEEEEPLLPHAPVMASASAATTTTYLFIDVLLLLAFSRPAPQLVEEDGDDQYGSDRDVEPEPLCPEDDQTVAQHPGDQHPDDHAADAADAAEQAGAADDHGRDGAQVVGGVAGD